jgi:2-dehydropantoate 2-reductase
MSEMYVAIANGRRKQRIKIHVNSLKPNPNVTDDPAKVGPVDIVLFAVKLWDSEKAAKQALPMIGPDTRVIPLQNGVDSAEQIAPILGADNVVAGQCLYRHCPIRTRRRYVVTHTSKFARLLCGRIDGKRDAQLKAFSDAAHAAGIDIMLSDAINRERWQKFVFLVGLSGATATTRQPLGPILADPDTRAFFHNLMREVVAVGRAKGVSIPEDFADDRMKFGDASPPTFKASMLHHLERGNRLQLDWLAGKVVDFGREVGVPTPANQVVYAMLKLHRMGTQVS